MSYLKILADLVLEALLIFIFKVGFKIPRLFSACFREVNYICKMHIQ